MQFLIGLILGIALALVAPRAWPLIRRYLPGPGALGLLAAGACGVAGWTQAPRLG